MPLARIVTDFPEEALDLATQLRARGFQVEILSPRVTPTTVADLEVQLDECAVDDVLAHAAQMAAGDVACVYVAPGALEEGGRSGMKTINLMVAQDDLPGREVFAQETAVIDPIPAEPIPVETPEPVFALASAHAEALNKEPVLDGDSPAVAVPIEPQFADVAVAARAEAGDQELLMMEIEAQTAPMAAVALAEPHRIDQTEVAPEPQVMTISAGSAESLVVAQHTLESETAETLEDRPERIEVSSIPLPPPQPMPRARVTMLRSRAESDRAFWRVAVAAAAMAALVVAAGSLWHRFRLLPEGLSAPASQQVLPFRKAAPAQNPQKNESPVDASAAPVEPAPVSSSGAAHGAPAPAAAASVPPAQPITTAPPPASASQVVVRSSAVKRAPAKKPSAKRRSSPEADVIAEDTVVFYNRKPGATRSRDASQPGVKQYSDAQ